MSVEGRRGDRGYLVTTQGDGAPWWLALALGIVATLVAAIGKLWTDNVALRRDATLARQAALEQSQQDSALHMRDLRRVIGWSASNPPEAGDRPDRRTAITIVEEPRRPRAPRPKKPT
jgi:heme exporter protein D